MSNMRYRRPSVKTILGVTKWKKRVKKALGVNKVMAPFRAVGNYQRRMLRRAGYYSPEMKAMRAAQHGKVAGPIGAIKVGDGDKDSGGDSSALLMAAMMAQGDRGKKGEDDESALLMAAMMAQGDKDEGKGSQVRGLAEAMMLSKMMEGDDDTERAPKAKRAAKASARRAKDDDEDESDDDRPRASRSGRSRKEAEEKESEPKRRRGWRLFGLFLVAALVAVGIFTVWFYWMV